MAGLRAQEDEIWARARDQAPARDFAGALRRGGDVALIAEVKRRSPGAGPIRPEMEPAEVARSYAARPAPDGAAAISVLTDREYFVGSLVDLASVRGSVPVQVLRKDFTIAPVQVAEARAHGADAVLLIVRILDDATLGELHEAADDLGMTALVEVHDGAELERALDAGARVVGVNNRDLSAFTTDLAITVGLMERMPDPVTVVSESGIRTPEDVDRLGGAGADAILVGEALLRAADPGARARELAGRPRRERRGR